MVLSLLGLLFHGHVVVQTVGVPELTVVGQLRMAALL